MKGLRNRQTRINPEKWADKKIIPGTSKVSLKKKTAKTETRKKRKAD